MTADKQKTGWITAGLLLGLILSSLDQTIVSTAMPTIARQLGGLSLYSWVFAVYMLASTATMPIYGKLADLFGRRIMYLTGLFLFLAGSVLCGLAGDMTHLIVFRAVQGLGAGALMPVAFTIIGDILPPERRGSFKACSVRYSPYPASPGPRSAGISSNTQAGDGFSSSTSRSAFPPS
ncbi:MFS transporter [Paenibacillus sp. P26]|nr:MFS transporter [Paenibacillus sp. P26]UUZ91884.1 MFS transporter [Paenibacillus sp. P25]